jgi:hypothetical protein
MKTCQETSNLFQIGQKISGTLKEKLLTFSFVANDMEAFPLSIQYFYIVDSDMYLKSTNRTHCYASVANAPQF